MVMTTDGNWIPIKIVTEKNSCDWVTIVTQEDKIGFTDLLWCAIWVSNESSNSEYALIFICGHCIKDGKDCFDVIVLYYL